MGINVFNWKSNLKMASNKVANKVTAVCFSEDSNAFVTVGTRHVKFWDLDSSCKSRVGCRLVDIYKKKTIFFNFQINQTVPLNGRNAILGDQKNNVFCAVAFGQGAQSSSVYTVTQSGLLCEFNEQRQLSKWVELRVSQCDAIAVLSWCLADQFRLQLGSLRQQHLYRMYRGHHSRVQRSASLRVHSAQTAPPWRGCGCHEHSEVSWVASESLMN